MRRRTCGGSGTGHGSITQDELLKLQISGQCPDESVRVRGFSKQGTISKKNKKIAEETEENGRGKLFEKLFMDMCGCVL